MFALLRPHPRRRQPAVGGYSLHKGNVAVARRNVREYRFARYRL